MERLREALGVALVVGRVAAERDIKYPAAAVAYYAFVSFIPLLLLVFAVVGERYALELYTLTPRFLTREAQRLVYEATTTASGRTGAGLFAVGVLAWAGTNVAVCVQTVVERVEDAAERPFAVRVRDGVVVLASIGFAIVSIVVTSALFALPVGDAVLGSIRFVLLAAALTVALFPLYFVLSRRVTTPSAALPGAFTAAVGWTIIHTTIEFFAANADAYAIYGVLSGVIIILTSLYVAAVLLMVGVIVNAMYADESDARGDGSSRRV